MDFCAIHSRGRKDRGVQLKCCLSQSNSSRRLLDNTPLLARAPGQITGRGNYGGLAAGGSSSSNSTTKNVLPARMLLGRLLVLGPVLKATADPALSWICSSPPSYNGQHNKTKQKKPDTTQVLSKLPSPISSCRSASAVVQIHICRSLHRTRTRSSVARRAFFASQKAHQSIIRWIYAQEGLEF